MRRHQTPFTALTSRSSAQPPLGTAASHRRDGEERPRCHRSRTALSCHHAAVPAAPRCCPRSISVAKNRCSAFGASGHRILPGSVPALRSHPLSRPGNLPPCPARFLFSLCLSCSLFWLFKAPRGSLGIIIFYYFFFLSKCQRAPSDASHGLQPAATAHPCTAPTPSAHGTPLPARRVCNGGDASRAPSSHRAAAEH